MDLIQVYVKYDLYEILELTNDTTTAEIKKKYKKLAIKFHPDKYLNSDELTPDEKKTLQSHFNLVGVAYDILLDESTRAVYDKARKEYLDAGQFGDLKKQFNNFKTSLQPPTVSPTVSPTESGSSPSLSVKTPVAPINGIEFKYGDESTAKKVFKEENMKLNTDNEKIAEEIRAKTKENLNKTFDIEKVDNFNELLTNSSTSDKNGYMKKFNTLFDTFRQKTNRSTEIMPFNQNDGSAPYDAGFGIISVTNEQGSSLDDAFNLMDVSSNDYVENNMSLDDRMSAYKRDFDTLKIPKINKEPKE
jgi:curved DNA-binding protein CbpA